MGHRLVIDNQVRHQHMMTICWIPKTTILIWHKDQWIPHRESKFLVLIFYKIISKLGLSLHPFFLMIQLFHIRQKLKVKNFHRNKSLDLKWNWLLIQSQKNFCLSVNFLDFHCKIQVVPNNFNLCTKKYLGKYCINFSLKKWKTTVNGVSLILIHV